MFVSVWNLIKFANLCNHKCINNFEHNKNVFPKDGALSAEISTRKCDN